jgi:hypothetical protein
MAGAEASTRFAPSLHISLRSHPKTEPCLCARRRMESDLRPIRSCERLSRRATRLAGAVRCQLRVEQSSSSRSPGGSSRGLAPAAYRPTIVRTSLSGRTPAGINLAHPLLSGDLMGVPNVRLFVAGAWTFWGRFSLSTSIGCMKLKRPHKVVLYRASYAVTYYIRHSSSAVRSGQVGSGQASILPGVLRLMRGVPWMRLT